MRRLLRSLLPGARDQQGGKTVEVTGVCNLMSASISPDRRGYASMIAWRQNGGAIETGVLELARQLPEGAQHTTEFMARFGPQRLVKVTLAAPPRPLASWLSGEIIAVHDASPDPELEARAAELLDPPPLQHPVLGTFTHHPRLIWEYYGKAQWRGEPVAIGLQGPGPFPDFDDLLANADTAAKVFEHQEELAKSLERVLQECAYPAWLQEWAQPSHGNLTAQEYASRLKLCTIYPSDDGSFEFEFDAGDLHDGAYVMASGTIEGGFEDAGIP